MKSLRPIEKIYHFLVGTKNFLYDRKLIEAIELRFPVVSVGNISFGGVGKSPFIILLAEELSLEYQVNIVTKSYKAAATEPQKVDLSISDPAALFGDEACIIQEKLPACSVWAGPNKASTAAASSINQPDIILIDDGFSHRRLKRNFDVLLLDATEGLNNYLREPRRNLRRAHAIVITKINLTSSTAVKELEKAILQLAPELKNSIFKSSMMTTLKIDKGRPLFVFCGLGRPETFCQDLVQQGFNILKKTFFPDHFQYSLASQKELLEKYLKLRAMHDDLKLVCTEKDYIKINYQPLKECIVVAFHKLTMEANEKEVLLEKIRQTL